MTMDRKSFRAEFLGAMRNVASSVTVVTTDGPAGCAGATVSAFCSLSADPPSVLICLCSSSRIARRVMGNGVFCVNVLPEEARGLAQRFAGRQDHALMDRFQNIEVAPSQGGPILAGANAFVCTLDNVISHGSHSICIGGVSSVSVDSQRPLTYLDGAYHFVRPQSLPAGAARCQ